jgi:thioredoxin-dependent peroxiredoxin
MPGLMAFWASLGLAATALAAVQSPPPAELRAGDPAPAFSLPGSDGRTYSLAEFKGKKVVVLAWYPKAFTGG